MTNCLGRNLSMVPIWGETYANLVGYMTLQAKGSIPVKITLTSVLLVQGVSSVIAAARLLKD